MSTLVWQRHARVPILLFACSLTACGEGSSGEPTGTTGGDATTSNAGSGGGSGDPSSGSAGSSSSAGGSSTASSGVGAGGIPTGEGLLFFDGFEYEAGRSNPNVVAAFQAAGWTGSKTEQAGADGANGWLHTATAVPGFAGAFPGASSSRVLVIEARPFTEDGQTDFYLQYGNASSSEFDDYIPGDVWFQFWMYPQDSGAEQSAYLSRNKFFYVCNDFYPCHSHLWMVGNSATPYNPHNDFPLGYPTDGEFFFNVSSASGMSTIYYELGDPYASDKLGQNDISDWMVPNRWTLVKMHFNTTSATGNSWEMWLRPYGGAWLKVAEWIGGVTPGFTWDIPADSVGGHRELRMPTTVGAFPGEEQYDYWLYMDDFAIATNEQALPVYSD